MIRLVATLAAIAALASANSTQVQIYTESSTYSYFGCYNETTDISGSDHTRALPDGIDEVKPGEMTVPMCLKFCAEGKDQYRYAGLEWSRECWCSQRMSGISEKLDDGQCNFACEGNKTQACGASLKLSVYKLTSSSAPAARLSSTLMSLAVLAAIAC